MAELRIGKPWRHRPALDCLGDGGRPGPRLLVGHQRHGSNFAVPMTALAMLLQDGENVSVERGSSFLDRRSGRGCRLSGNCGKEHDQDEPVPHANSVLAWIVIIRAQKQLRHRGAVSESKDPCDLHTFPTLDRNNSFARRDRLADRGPSTSPAFRKRNAMLRSG